MRTASEIVARIEEIKNRDMFGFSISGLIEQLPYANAKPYLKDGVTESEWNSDREGVKSPIAQIAEYMPFAISKAEDHRGLSAGRSVDRMSSWVWLMGDEKYNEIDWDNYQNYGAPILRQICEMVGIDWRAIAHGKDFENMSLGKPCIPSCDEGCGQ